MATPAGVISTFWKNLYLRSGFGMNGFSSETASLAGGAECVAVGSSLAAAAVENGSLAVLGRHLLCFPVVASSSRMEAPRVINELAPLPDTE